MSATSPVGREVGGRMPVRWALGELAGPNLLVPLLAVAATVALVFEPMAAVALVLAVFAAIALPRLQPEHVLVALLLYMPFENQALTYAPGGWTPFVRYAPEALIDLAVILVVFGNLERVWTGLGRLRWPLVLLLSSWVASAIWSGIEATTAFVGFRSELRFLPLLLVAVLARDPARDARLYGRAIVIVGTVEAAIIAAQALAGAPARDAFAPDWTIEINGVAFADAGFNKPETNFGTFSNYNAAGTFLVFAWIIMAAAGSRRLGLPARLGFFMGCAMALAVGLSGSRESGLALAVAALIIAHVRFRRWVAPAVVFATVAALLVGPWVMAARNGVPEGEVNGKSFSERWAYVMSPDAWSTDQRNNFRLFLLRENASLVTDNSPALGFGIGSVSDKRTTLDGSNPLYQTWAGRKALTFGYIYDGNWGLLLMEVGIVGLLALVLLLLAVLRTGFALLRQHWLGLALIAQLAAVVVLGFFAPVMQLRLPTAMLWLTTGLALAMVRNAQADKQNQAEAAPAARPFAREPDRRSGPRRVRGRREPRSAGSRRDR